MFNLSGSEIIVILLLALVVLGPEKLPDALRRAGRTYAELKKMGNTFQDEMRSVIDEPVKEMRETADLLRSSAEFPDVDPKKAGSGGRAALSTGGSAAPERPTTPKSGAAAAGAVGQPSVDASPSAAADRPTSNGDQPAANGDEPARTGDQPASGAGDDDEALINRTLSGRTGPPAGDAAP